jgi:hypothetical protein
LSAWESAYFLLFGRQLSRGGGVAEIWLKAKLPSTGAFSCQEADFYSMVEFRVRWAVSQAAVGGPGTPESIASAEVQGIQALRGWVEEIVECCDLNLRAGAGCSLCSWAYADVVDYHAQMGFATYETEVSPPSDGLDSLCLCSYDYQVNSAEHVLSTGAVSMSVSFSTLDLPGVGTLSATDIFSFLSDLGEFYAAEGTAFYAALSDQTMFCSSSGDGPSALRGGSGASVGHDEIDAAFGACEVGVWYNVLYTDHIATLAVKVKGMDVEGAMWLLGFSNQHSGRQDASEFAKLVFDAAANNFEGEDLLVLIDYNDWPNPFWYEVIWRYISWKWKNRNSPYNQTNDCEKELIRAHPLCASRLAAHWIIANQLAKYHMGGNSVNDCSDAYRHALFNALNAVDCGIELAREFGIAHECISDTEMAREMDLHNNEVGYSVIENNPDIKALLNQVESIFVREGMRRLIRILCEQLSDGAMVVFADPTENDPNNFLIPSLSCSCVN